MRSFKYGKESLSDCSLILSGWMDFTKPAPRSPSRRPTRPASVGEGGRGRQTKVANLGSQLLLAARARKVRKGSQRSVGGCGTRAARAPIRDRTQTVSPCQSIANSPGAASRARPTCWIRRRACASREVLAGRTGRACWDTKAGPRSTRGARVSLSAQWSDGFAGGPAECRTFVRYSWTICLNRIVHYR